MRPAAHFRASSQWNGQKDNLTMSSFGLLCYLRLRELQGQPAPTRRELFEVLPTSERTVNGGLAELKRSGLVVESK